MSACTIGLPKAYGRKGLSKRPCKLAYVKYEDQRADLLKSLREAHDVQYTLDRGRGSLKDERAKGTMSCAI